MVGGRRRRRITTRECNRNRSMSRRVLLGAGAGAAAAGIFYFVQFLHCRTNLVFFKADVSSKLIYYNLFLVFTFAKRSFFISSDSAQAQAQN